MSKLDKIVEDLSSLTVLEAADLAKLLEEKWGVSAAAPVAMAAGPAAAAAPAAEAHTVLTYIVKHAGEHKINVIKVGCKSVQSLGPKEANALVEADHKAVKAGVTKEEAETIKKKLEESGAKVEIK